MHWLPIRVGGTTLVHTRAPPLSPRILSPLVSAPVGFHDGLYALAQGSCRMKNACARIDPSTTCLLEGGEGQSKSVRSVDQDEGVLQDEEGLRPNGALHHLHVGRGRGAEKYGECGERWADLEGQGSVGKDGLIWNEVIPC